MKSWFPWNLSLRRPGIGGIINDAYTMQKLQRTAVHRPRYLLPTPLTYTTHMPLLQARLSLTPVVPAHLILRNKSRRPRRRRQRMTSARGSIEASPLLHRFRRQMARQRPLVLHLRRRRMEQSIHILRRVLGRMERRLFSLRMCRLMARIRAAEPR